MEGSERYNVPVFQAPNAWYSDPRPLPLRSARMALSRLVFSILLAPLALLGAAGVAQAQVELPPDDGSDDGTVELAPDDGGDSVELPAEPVQLGEDAVALQPDFVVDPAELQVLLKEGLELADDGDHLDAVLRFNDIVNNGDPMWDVVRQARFALAVSLHDLDLFQSALIHLEAIVDSGPDHPKYRKALPYLLSVSRRTVGDSNVRARIADYAPELYPPDEADELHFIVGQYYYSEGSYNDALTRFQQVTPESGEFYVRARYLEGVIHIQESNLGTDPKKIDSERLARAAEAFKAVLRYQRDHGSSEVIDKVAAMSNLALGRLFFSTRQYAQAVRYYDQVDESDPAWLQSMFEVSWVYFQLKNYARALGNLHTLNSPYFADQYFPESRVLQALILFYNCRYDEANVIIKDFVQDYYPLMTELRDEINQIADPNEFYRWLGRLSRAEETEFSGRFKRIFNAALADRKLRRKFVFVKTLNDELAQLDSLSASKRVASPFLDDLKGQLTAYRSLVVGEAGGLAQARLLRVLKELKQHLASALKIKGETLKAQRGVLADSLRAEQAAAAAAHTEIVVDSEHMEWPFVGEYWRDELGSYLYDINSRCDRTPPPSEE